MDHNFKMKGHTNQEWKYALPKAQTLAGQLYHSRVVPQSKEQLSLTRWKTTHR